MKKIALFGVLALSMGFVACDEVEDPTGGPQVNPQLPVFEAQNLNLSVPEGAVLNLKDLIEAEEKAVVANVDAVDFPYSEYTLQLVMQVSPTADFAHPGEMTINVTENGPVAVSPSLLQGVYYENVTKDPREGTMHVRFNAYAVSGSTVAALGEPGVPAAVGAINVVPLAAEVTYEDAYYVIGSFNNWSLTDGVLKMQNSGKSVYDDPVFSVAVNITGAQADEGWEWAVVPASTVAAGSLEGNVVFGPTEDTVGELAGMLEQTSEHGIMQEQGSYLFTVDVQEMTFEFALAIPCLYTPGNSNGWSQTASQILTTTDYLNYSGFAHLNGEFKLSSEPSWSGINYGSTGTAGELTTDGGAGNLNASEDALYWCKVNLPALTYEITAINSLGVIGSLNGWSAQEALEPSADFLIWSGVVTFDEGGEWKFRMNDDWGINLGGEEDNLVYDAGNLKSPGAGKYQVTLDLSAVPYTVAITPAN